MRILVVVLFGAVLIASCGGGTDEKLALANSVGDVAAGEALFSTPMDGVPHSSSCSTCHTLDGTDGRSPSLAGISDAAGTRVEGLSKIDYLRQSILDPSAVREGDWNAVMPYQYPDELSADQINNLIAFLLTQ